MLDNVAEVSHFTHQNHGIDEHSERRPGRGIAGLANAFNMLDIPYGRSRPLVVAAAVLRTI